MITVLDSTQSLHHKYEGEYYFYYEADLAAKFPYRGSDMLASCQCERVRFVCPLPQPLKIYICHCTRCRHQSSSAFGISAIFPSFDLPSETGPHVEFFTRRTLKGHDLDCYFCKHCGARLVHRVAGQETCSVKGGCLEELSRDMMADKGKVVHIWTQSAVVEVPEGFQKYEEEPDG